LSAEAESGQVTSRPERRPRRIRRCCHTAAQCETELPSEPRRSYESSWWIATRFVSPRTGRFGRSRIGGDMNIDLHAPTMPIFLVSLVLAVLALLGHFVVIPYITLYGFWIAIIAYGVLAVGTVMKT
jgi:hypothetical protein